MQKAIIVGGSYSDAGITDLNRHLNDGWTVVSNRPMGGAAAGGGNAYSITTEFKSLVIIERNDDA